ncbi:glycosyltransferase family 9 protein [Pontiellaceae bacterium B1224]|nr:glycosyltransferase family 9 protein [Pontiellaceae bacterium B1224]
MVGSGGFQYSRKKVRVARVLELLLLPFTWVLRKPSRDVRRILIVEPYGLGDVANLAVMFEPLLEAFSGVEIHLLISPSFSGLYDDDARITKVHACRIPWADYENKYQLGKYSIFRLLVQFRALRKLRFDIGFDVRGDVRNQLLLLLAGCRRRVGATNYMCSNIITRGLLLTDNVGNYPLEHVTRLHLSLCRAVGCNIPTQIALPVLKPSAGRIRGSSGKVIVHTGGGSKFKKWQQESWIGLCERLDNVLLIGAPNEAERLETIRSSLSSDHEVLIPDNLQHLIDIIYESKLFIGLDSGPMNIASLLGISCVALYGPGVPELYHPISTPSCVLHHKSSFPCSPCTQQMCYHPDATCTESISVDEVVEAVGAILEAGQSPTCIV